ncbi:MAG: bifunctional 4-hydroxy-2-oxoglutarate aldolase/2-dehydro-3-deoxy-phosphogluconate aldolase [Clostridia bacterium]|nr:bifunctional 4-hydroxy-2-oxoglutarate aldolase/2-dehydro-3-deoxy-phosphogluconate aldolase [Clostridia bacterium]
MSKLDTIHHILNEKLIVIMRGYSLEEGLRAVDAMAAGGVSLVEVTFDQTGKTPLSATTDLIAAIAARGDICVGAGTVMTPEQAELAAEAGAKYIISPDACEAVIRRTARLGLVSIPGAMTPTEAANAHRWGADFVKLFPIGAMGPSYLKAVAAPLSHIRFLAVGSVREHNLTDYLAAGACGAGIGAGSIAPKDASAEVIAANAARYLALAKGE